MQDSNRDIVQIFDSHNRRLLSGHSVSWWMGTCDAHVWILVSADAENLSVSFRYEITVPFQRLFKSKQHTHTHIYIYIYICMYIYIIHILISILMPTWGMLSLNMALNSLDLAQSVVVNYHKRIWTNKFAWQFTNTMYYNSARNISPHIFIHVCLCVCKRVRTFVLAHETICEY